MMHHGLAGPRHWYGTRQTWQVHPTAGWSLWTGVKLKDAAFTEAGLRLLDTATESGSLGCLTILSSGSDTGTRLGLLNIALGVAVLVSLAILGLGYGGRLSCGTVGKEPWVAVI